MDSRRHYDALRVARPRDRARGPALELKRFNNGWKRAIILAHARGAEVLVDIGCGRGGDLFKWQAAGVRRVRGLDSSRAQVNEARRRARNAGVSDRFTFDVACSLEGIEDASADVVTAMFSLNYVFGDDGSASDLLGGVARVLRPGGRFVGIFTDGDRVLATGPVANDTFALRFLEDSTYSMYIEDTVMAGAGRTAPAEHIVLRDRLERVAAQHGLRPLPRTPPPNPCHAVGWYATAAALYDCFSFKLQTVD